MQRENSIYKKAQAEFDVGVNDTRSINLNATFSTQDENTALLDFVIKKDGVLLPLGEPVQAVIYLVGNQLKVKKNMEVDREKSSVSYLLTPDEVKHYGKVDGEVYIHYNNEGKQSLSVHKFSFNIEQALIDQDLDVIENVYISDLEDIKSEYLDKFENLKTELEDKVAKLQTDTTQLQKDAKELEEKFNAIDPDQFVKETGDTVSGTLTFLNEGEKQIQIGPSGVLVNGYDVYTKEKPIQEFPLTDTAGKLLFKANVDFNNLDASFESTFVGYVTTSTNVPFNLNTNGYFTLKMRTSGYATATFQPYNSNVVIANRREGNTIGWKGWEMPPVDNKQVQTIIDAKNTWQFVSLTPKNGFTAAQPLKAYYRKDGNRYDVRLSGILSKGTSVGTGICATVPAMLQPDTAWNLIVSAAQQSTSAANQGNIYISHAGDINIVGVGSVTTNTGIDGITYLSKEVTS